ncbi:MAG: hypothetical protein WDO73_33860 [Ignavibacteriota bacterium]
MPVTDLFTAEESPIMYSPDRGLLPAASRFDCLTDRCTFGPPEARVLPLSDLRAHNLEIGLRSSELF